MEKLKMKTTPHFTITGLNENEKLTQVFGSENLKTFPGVIRKAEKFITKDICRDFDLYNLYLTRVYYIHIEDNFTHETIYKIKLSDLIDRSNGVHLLEKSLAEKFKFINESPRYYIHMLNVLNEKSFLELRGFNLGLNEICLKIENVLNEYLNNNQRAA